MHIFVGREVVLGSCVSREGGRGGGDICVTTVLLHRLLQND